MMAFFNKLFFSSSSKRKTINSNQSLSQFPFNTDQVRILLYRECDTRGRRLLFDSSAIEKVDLNGGSKEKIKSQSQGDKKQDHKFFSNASSYVEISDGIAYKHSRPSSSDITRIGEMIFGTLAMSFRGTTLKIHWLQSPVRIFCSQVFLSPLHSKLYPGRDSSGNMNPMASTTSNHSSFESYTSLNSASMPFSVCVQKNLNMLSSEKEKTKPVSTPQSQVYEENVQLHSALSTEDSGYSVNERWTSSGDGFPYSEYSTRSSLGSVFSEAESLRKLSVDSAVVVNDNNKSSDMSIRRRILRHLSTSFENRNSMSDFVGFTTDNYQTETGGGSDGYMTRNQCSKENQDNRSNPEMIRVRGASGDSFSSMPGNGRQVGRRAKLGLAVCITMSENFEQEMEQFCCEHIALLESMLCRLRASVESAYINHKNFLQIMVLAWQSTANWIQDLFTAPRVYSPVWLNINSSDSKATKNLADTFMKELNWLLSFADTKDTNFFISTVLTALLTYHLGWVTSIASFNSEQCTQVKEMMNEQNEKLREISHKYPYNALWAQMSDLYGSIGNPPRISRTIIYGTDKNAIEKLLHILTYFMRCGEIKRSSKIEIIDEKAISDAVARRNNGKIEPKPLNKRSGMTRSPTCFKNLHVDDFKKHNDSCETIFNSEHKEFINSSEHELKAINTDLKTSSHDVIRFTLTTPENVELTVNYSELNCTKLECDDVEEAVECKSDNEKPNSKNLFEELFCKMKEPIKDGLIWENIEISQGIEKNNEVRDHRSNLKTTSSLSAISETRLPNDDTKGYASLLDLKPLGVAGACEIKERTFSCEKNDILSPKMKSVEKNNVSSSHNKNPEGVVFVLGDNEALINIKKSNEDVSNVEQKSDDDEQTDRRQCCHHHHKKHSGVKFNFEKYPQIATNYMKNKNLDLSSYDFLDKSSKFEDYFKSGPSTSAFQVTLPKPDDEMLTSSSEVCKYCSGIDDTRVFQTPSNATELEFETEDDKFLSIKPTDSVLSTTHSSSCSFAPSVETIIEGNGKLENVKDQKKLPREYTEDGSKAKIDLIHLPLPGVGEASSKDQVNEKFTSGFVPSLLVGVTDHYIPDMALQGILAAPQKWEVKLKQDLVLSSHCAALLPSPVENVAVVADMSKWDVKVISSQAYGLPYNGTSANSVGMSQLVSTMLETVHAMSLAGMSAYECLSYIEVKLQEMYLQSETLAAFLLATEFCSLNTVTSALNLSANDVPLLLSVASVHSPQVTKKYGISFR